MLTRDSIKHLFEYRGIYTADEVDYFAEHVLNICSVLDKLGLGNDPKQIFKLVKRIFHKRLNITKNLKILNFKNINDGYLVYTAKYRENHDWEEAQVEIEFRSDKVVAFIVFIETGEIRQWHLKL